MPIVYVFQMAVRNILPRLCKSVPEARYVDNIHCMLGNISSFCHLLIFYPHAFLKKRQGYCNRLCPSVRPSCYLLLNHWKKSIQTWCVSCSHEWGVQRHIFFARPWGPGEGPKGQISLNIIKFQLQGQFQRFFNQTLCVFSHMKDIKHISWDFHLVALVVPQGTDLGVP